MHEYQRAYEIEISQEKYEILRDIIEENKSRQIFYNLPLGIQCTVWTMNVLQEAGVINQFIKPNMNMAEFYGDFYSRVMGEELGRPFGEFIGNFTGVTQTLLYNPYMQEIGFKLNEFKENIKNYISPLSISLYDPLILDLNGNGKIDLTSTSNGVHLDHDANDVSFKSSWVDK